MATPRVSSSWRTTATLTDGDPVFYTHLLPAASMDGPRMVRPPLKTCPRLQFVGSAANIAALPAQFGPLFPLLAQFHAYLQSEAQKAPAAPMPAPAQKG